MTSKRLDLPFIRRRRDIVTQIYDHRAGIYAVLVMVLLLAILLVGSKVRVEMVQHTDNILVDLQTLEELRAEAQRLQREVMLRQSEADGEFIRNAVSNLGADPGDTRGQRPQMSGVLDANREAWDQGMREIDAMRARQGDEGANVNGDSRQKGHVMIEFSLVNPVRYSAVLVNPGFQCERGGVVVVDIVVNRNGEVVMATVARGASDSDACMNSAAVGAARGSSFNVDTNAPARQNGMITYTFIAQ